MISQVTSIEVFSFEPIEYIGGGAEGGGGQPVSADEYVTRTSRLRAALRSLRRYRAMESCQNGGRTKAWPAYSEFESESGL